MDITALPILSYEELCNTVGIDPDLRPWRRIAGLDDHVFNVLIRVAWVRYCESIQLAPASEAHHHAGPGGLLLHTHEVITLALKQRRGLQLPVGGSISVINNQRHLWTCGVFAACLLHDIGKLSASIRIQMNLRDGSTRLWNPHDEPLSKFAQAKSYSLAFIKTPYAYHHYISLSFFDILPRVARAWIANETELMRQICAHLRGDRFESGIIGEIVEQADMKSTAKDLQLPVSAQRFSNTIAVIDRFMGFIRTWIREHEIKININGGMGWVDNEGYVYFVCRSLAQKIIDECADKGINDVPRDHVRIYDILQDHGYAIPTPEGKAIWNIAVKGADFHHRFTCLKFEARRLTVPTRLLSPFTGEIIVEDANARPSKTTALPHAHNTEATQENTATAKEIPQHTSSEDAAESIPEDDNAQADEEKKSSTGGGNAQEPASDGAEQTQDAEAPAEENPIGSLVFAAAKRRRKDAEAQEKAQEAAQAAEKTQIPATVEIIPEAAAVEKTYDTEEIPIRDSIEDEPAEKTHDAAAKMAHVAPQITGEKLTPNVASKPETSEKTSENATATADTAPPLYHGITIDTPNIQQKFLNWLRVGLIEKTILINNPVAKVHIVKEGVLILAPGIFKDFCIKHSMPESDHRRLSKKFDRLKINIKSEENMNIHTYWAKSSKRAGQVHGRLLPFSVVYEHGYPIPKPNKYIIKNFTDSPEEGK